MMCCDDEHKKMKICWGAILLLFGVIWYLKETNAIVLEPFWPIMVMLFGLLLILKGFMLKPMKKK